MGKIRRLTPKEYEKCGAIWDMQENPELTALWKEELVLGKRLIFVYEENGEFLGEGALVLESDDPDYTIPGQRAYVSRMIVREEYRSRGIGGAILEVLFREAEKRGIKELSIGVNIENEGAQRLYRRKGFTEQIARGEDENGEYVKLLAHLDEPVLEESGIFTCYFAARAALLTAGIFLLASMALGPLRFTNLSIGFGVASAVLSLLGVGFGFASWEEEE